MSKITVTINGQAVQCDAQHTLMDACESAGTYVPHLCHHAGLTPHGSCRLCIVNVNGKISAACTTPVSEGATVITETPDLNQMRLRLTQLLFTEGNHFCPSCELSGNCQLQATAYHLGMLENHYPHGFPHRQLDASHDALIIDRDRCINCALCVRASQQIDHKHVFELVGRGPTTTIASVSDSGLLADTALEKQDSACHICPTGALLLREKPYSHPIGTRLYDNADIAVHGNQRPERLDDPQDSHHGESGIRGTTA